MTNSKKKIYGVIIIALLVAATCVVFAMSHRNKKSTLSAESVTDTSSEITQNTKESVTVAPIVITEKPKETKPADTEVVTDEEGSKKYVQQNVPQNVTDVYVTDETPQENNVSYEETKEPEQTTQTTEVTTEPEQKTELNSLGLPVKGTTGQELYGNDGKLYAWNNLFGWLPCGDGGGALTCSPEEQDYIDSGDKNRYLE